MGTRVLCPVVPWIGWPTPITFYLQTLPVRRGAEDTHHAPLLHSVPYMLCGGILNIFAAEIACLEATVIVDILKVVHGLYIVVLRSGGFHGAQTHTYIWSHAP